MFYQNNNDYMRDAFYYSQPQNTYPYNGMYNYMPHNSIENMYPQVYRTIYPVVKRIIANNPYQYYTEDNLNNMVDSVYNIVEGDVSTLTNTAVPVSNENTQTSVKNSTINNNVKSEEPTNVMSNNNLLKDFIKVIIIEELLSRQNNSYNMNNYGMGAMQSNYYDPRCMR